MGFIQEKYEINIQKWKKAEEKLEKRLLSLAHKEPIYFALGLVVGTTFTYHNIYRVFSLHPNQSTCDTIRRKFDGIKGEISEFKAKGEDMGIYKEITELMIACDKCYGELFSKDI